MDLIPRHGPGARSPRVRAGTTVRAALLGLAAGFLSGLFGVGGGILIVPVLVLAMGMAQRAAHGTSLAAILPIALAGTAGYAVEGEVDWAAAAALTAGAMAGAALGTHWLHVLPARVLTHAFAAVLAASALRLVLDQSEGAGRGDLGLAALAALAALGVVSGTLAGLLGVGGGVVMIPAMIILFDLPAVVAKGTSLAVIVPTAVVGTARNLRRGNADAAVAAAVGISGVVSSYAASKVSVGLDEAVSNALFAGLLAVVAARMLVTARREGPDPAVPAGHQNQGGAP